MWLIQLLVWMALTRGPQSIDPRRLLGHRGRREVRRLARSVGRSAGDAVDVGKTAIHKGDRMYRSRVVRAGTIVSLTLVVGYVVMRMRARSKISRIPNTFACKARMVPASTDGLGVEFSQRNLTGHWVHDVLCLHGGSRFSDQGMSYGVVELVDGPIAVDPRFVKSIEEPIAFRYRVDSGAILELLCSRYDEARVAGPFVTPFPMYVR